LLRLRQACLCPGWWFLCWDGRLPLSLSFMEILNFILFFYRAYHSKCTW
jgi:hypothetical protein